MIYEMAHDGFFGFMMACLTVILSIILVVFLYALGYSLINNVNMPSQTGQAVITGKEIISEYTTVVMQTVMIGNTTTLIPITTHYDTQYVIKLQKDSEASSVNVGASLYTELEVGREIKVQYHTGRIDKAFHAESLL
jgi:hypothetical protein